MIRYRKPQVSFAKCWYLRYFTIVQGPNNTGIIGPMVLENQYY